MNLFYLIDIDGCLTEGKNKNINLKYFSRLLKTLSTVDRYSLCTGRSAVYVESIAQFLSLNDWCICENGAYLYHSQTNEIVVDSLVDEKYQEQLQLVRIRLQDVLGQDFIKFELGKEYSLSVNSISGDIDSLYKSVLDILSDEKYNFNIDYSPTAVDITPFGVSKKRGVISFKEKVLNKESDYKLIGIGDSSNDLPFIELCDLVGCPSNAHKFVKSTANYISPYKATESVLDIVNFFESNK